MAKGMLNHKEKQPHFRKRLFYAMPRLLKRCIMPFAIFIIILAILFSLFRALTPLAKQYKGRVEQHLSHLLGQPVTIQDMETSWYWFQPVLKMDHVILSDDKHRVLKFNQLLVGINLFSSLWHWQIQPGVLYVADAHLTLRQGSDHWDIDGLSHDRQSMSFDTSSYLPVLSWIFSQQKIIIKHVSAMIHFRDGTLIPLQDLNVSALHSYGHYRLNGSARLAQTTPTEVSVIADIQLNPNALKNASGHAYLSVHHLLPAQWQSFFPKSTYHINGGEGDVELWIDVAKGHFLSLQSSLDFNHLAVSQDGKMANHLIQNLQANLAWRTTTEGWQLTADDIQLRVDGESWPNNSLSLDYRKLDDQYHAFVKHLSLQSLAVFNSMHSFDMKEWFAMNPVGDLLDTQFIIKSGLLDYVLTRFSNLGWTGKDTIPSVRQLSGVINWQPTEGRLELDSEGALIDIQNLNSLHIDELNAAFDWKRLSQGLRVSMDRFVMSAQDLVVSAEGTLDEPFLPDANLRMTAEFSANNARHWLDYIPSQIVKPKLESWLKKDIKRVEKASGRIIVNGPLAEFPFDKQQGEFSINSYLTGVDLLFTKNWPLTRNIDAHLQVINRQLDVDVFHADLQDVPVNQVNLVINDMGLGQEALLVHGQLHAPASDIKQYLSSSPLRSRFVKWGFIDVLNTVGLDLNLEVPLYPESDHVLAKGTLSLDNNKAIFHHGTNDLVLNDLSGALQFDEYGITHGVLNGAIEHDPVVLTIKSERKHKPRIEIHIDGGISIDMLRAQFGEALFGVMSGHLKVHSLLTLPDNAGDFNHLQIQSSLKGVVIDLPAPLGKMMNETIPLVIDVDFNETNKIQLRLHYKDILITASKINPDEWAFQLQQPDITADLRYNLSSNTLSGNIQRLQLTNMFASTDQKNWFLQALSPKDIPNLNIEIDAFKLDDVDVGSLVLKSTSNANGVIIQDAKIVAPEYQLLVQGDWKQSGQKNNTTLKAELQLTDLGKALARWHKMPAVEAQRGTVIFNGGWAGAINQFSLDKVTGSLQMMLKTGRISHFDKATEEKLGLGKLLSILSLQTIPRRLQLDFSDLSKGGYTFDEFKGTFDLQNGVMSTKDSYLDGPVAYASMKGDLDVVHHLYDVELRVSPYIMASLPIVVTIAGGPVAGPIAGIATWVASKLINKGIQQISAYTYKISGPWRDPIVQQVHIYRKKQTTN